MNRVILAGVISIVFALVLFTVMIPQLESGGDMTAPVTVIIAFALIHYCLMPSLYGWNALAEKFPVRRDFSGDWLNFQTYKMSTLLHYKGCVSIGFNTEGMTMKLWGFLFAKQVQVPWEKVQSIEEQPMGLYTNIRFIVEGAEPIAFLYTGSLRRYVEDKLPAIGQTKLLENKRFPS